MRPQLFIRTTLLAVALFAASQASAEGAGVGIKVSSLGIGAEFTKALTPRVNVRVGGNFFNYSYSGSEDDIDYDFELKLKSFTGLVDLHPTGGSFRLSGGFLANSNKLDAIGVTSGTYSIGNGSYTSAQVGTLSGKIDFKKSAPYAGIGFGNAAKGKGVGVTFDVGVVFQGAPRVSLTATGTASSNQTFQNDLRMEQTSLQEDLNVFKHYPVVALGISYRF